MTEIYELPLGRIIFGHTDDNLTVGCLVLNPNQALPKHSRPVLEQLTQIFGTCSIKLFDGDTLEKEVVLREGDTIGIPADQIHIHSNPTKEKSVTLFKFEGDVSEQVDQIRNTFKKVLST